MLTFTGVVFLLYSYNRMQICQSLFGQTAQTPNTQKSISQSLTTQLPPQLTPQSLGRPLQQSSFKTSFKTPLLTSNDIYNDDDIILYNGAQTSIQTSIKIPKTSSTSKYCPKKHIVVSEKLTGPDDTDGNNSNDSSDGSDDSDDSNDSRDSSDSNDSCDSNISNIVNVSNGSNVSKFTSGSSYEGSISGFKPSTTDLSLNDKILKRSQHATSKEARFIRSGLDLDDSDFVKEHWMDEDES